MRYIGVIARRIGAIVPGLAGVRLAVNIVSVIRITIPVIIRIVTPSQPVTPPPAVASVMPAMVPVTPVATAETIVQVGDTAVKSTTVESTTVESTKPAAVKAPAAAVRCVSKIRLAEDGRGQQPGCDARDRPPLLGPGFAIA